MESSSSIRVATNVVRTGVLVLLYAAFGCRGPVEGPPPAAPAVEDEAPRRAPSNREESSGEESIFLSMLEANVHPRAMALVESSTDDTAFASQLRVRLHVMRAYRDLGELSRRTRHRAVNGIFQVTDLSNLWSEDRPRPGDGKSSFVLDYDQPEVAESAKPLLASGSIVTAGTISKFVAEYIDHKTYTHGFDIASRVASNRAGDCTEHAVLTAALLRRFDMPARLVFGIVLVGVSDGSGHTDMFAAGHAWVEHFDGKRWKIVDAALNPEGETSRRTGVPGLPEGAQFRLAYLPLTVMRDESASFSRSLMEEAGIDTVVGLEVDAVASGM